MMKIWLVVGSIDGAEIVEASRDEEKALKQARTKAICDGVLLYESSSYTANMKSGHILLVVKRAPMVVEQVTLFAKELEVY